LEPWVELFPTPAVHADLAALAALAAPHQDRATGTVKIALRQRERLADPQARAPEHDDQAAQSVSGRAVAGCAHDPDDLLGRRWVGGVA
jgi:hypothetical protein